MSIQSTRKLGMALALMLACSSQYEQAEDQDIDGEQTAGWDEPVHMPALEVEPGEFDQKALDEFQRRFQEKHGPIAPLSDDTEIHLDPFSLWENEPEHDSTEKAVVIPAHGWAMTGSPVLQKKNQTPKAHCDLFGLSCDNTIHTEMSIIQALDKYDLVGRLVGRCGRYDGGKDFSWLPCLLPNVYPTAVGQTWTFRVDLSTCPNDSVARGVVRWGLDRAMEQIAAHTDLEFVEITTNNQNILFRCEELAGVDPNGMMMGYPTGSFNMKSAVGQATEEVCDDASWPPDATDGTGNYTYMMTDMFYSYSRAVVAVDWDHVWETLIGCHTSGEEQGYMFRTLFLHELAHVFGFSHHNWSPPSGPNSRNIMKPTASCATMRRRDSMWNYRMSWTIDNLDMRTGSALTIQDEDLSCLFPQ